MNCRAFCDIWASVWCGYAALICWKDKLLSVIWNCLLRQWDMGFLLQWSSFSTQKGQSSRPLQCQRGSVSTRLQLWPQDILVSCFKSQAQTSAPGSWQGTEAQISGAVSGWGVQHLVTLCQRHWNCTYMPSSAWSPWLFSSHSLHFFSQTHIQTILLLALHTMCFKCHTACSPMPKTFCPSLMPKYSKNYVLKDTWVKMSPPTHPHKYTNQT